MNKQLIYEIVMPDFPRTVKLSDARRAKYFKPSDRLALSYLEKKPLLGKNEAPELNPVDNTAWSNKKNIHKLKDGFIWKDHKLSTKRIEWRLYNLETKEYIIKNASTAGTPNIEIINGQKFYNSGYHPQVAGKIMTAIHDYMIPFLKGLEPITEYPITIDGFMYDYGKTCEISKGRMWDCDNRQMPYNKAFCDVMQECKVFKQDDFEHIVGPPRLIFVNLDEAHISNRLPSVRTLVYQIYKVSV